MAVVDDATFHIRSKAGVIQGIPLVAVEIVSSSDQVDEIEEKIDTHLAAGTQAVWIVNPKRKTILLHRLGHQPRLFDETRTLESQELSGLSLKLAELF